MTAIGIELAGNSLTYVLVDRIPEGLSIRSYSRIALLDARNPDSLRAFQAALNAVLTEAKPDLIALKDKPQSGGMKAGAAAIKMEAILLLATPCGVRFVTGAAINNCSAPVDGLKKYAQPAFKAAAVELLKD